MNQLDLEQRFNLEQTRINRLLDERLRPIDQRVATLERPTATPSVNYTPVNYLPNTAGPEWSYLAYTSAGVSASTVSDDNRRAYNWYYQTAGDTRLDASASLLASGHTLFAGLDVDAPVWDAVNGTFLLGGDTTLYDISCPLPTDFVFPGQIFRIYFEASIASTSVDIGTDQQFYCGFWDNTAGQRKWIEGSFTPTASVYGASGSRTLKYKIHAKTDSGTEMLSSEITVNNCPDTLTESNHVRLSLAGAPGFIYFGIYRRDGSTYRKVGEIRNSIDLQFYDMQENSGSPEPGYPSVSASTPQAYAITSAFEPGELSSSQFASHTMTIQVPLSYNRSLTDNGQQYFRFGVDAFVGDSASRRGIVIRRLCVSEGYGGWTRSPLDLQALSGPTSTATGAPAPGGGPPPEPPQGGDGGPTCVALDTMVEMIDPHSRESYQMTMWNVDTNDWVVCGATALPIVATKEGEVQETVVLTTENGLKLTATGSHRLVTSVFDTKGTSVKRVKEGDTVLTFQEGRFVESRIIEKRIVTGTKRVKSLTLPAPHLYVTNGFVSHNRKIID